MQMVYQIIAAYFNDNDADELTADPVFTEILDKDLLASQPTISVSGIAWMKPHSLSLIR